MSRAVKAADVDRFIARPIRRRPIVLVYGPDAGLVRERVDALVHASVDDPNDPFALVRIEGDELSANPSRLVEEAHTVPLFGGRRAVLVQGRSPQHRRRGRGRWSQRRRPNAASSSRPATCARPRRCARCARRRRPPPRCPAIADNERDLARLIDDEMRAAKLTIAPDARAALVVAARRRPPGLAQRDAQARALRPRPGARRARRRDGGGRRRLRRWRSTACSTRPSPARPRDVETEFGKARAGGSVAGGHRLGGDPPGRQSAQDEARDRRRRLDRVRHEARRAAGAFHAREDWSARRCAPGRRRGCCAPWSSSPRPRSRRAASRRSPKRSRSARCCRSR